MRGSAFVIQRGLPETRPNFYGRESEEPPPEMAVIDDLYQLRLHGKAGFFKGVNKLTLTGSIPTRWAIRAEVTRQEFHKLMTEYYQACKLAGVVPNPNGYYYDGRVLATPFTHNIAQPGFFKTGGQIPEPIVRLAGLVEGDTLDYCYENDLLVVESVNGIGDFAYVRSLAPQVPLLKKRQPRFMWPLERFGHPHVPIMSLRGPLYGGANFYIIGDGRTGKTTMELLVLDALANIAERMPWLNVSMVIAFIGDREIDEEAYEDLLAAHPKAHMELYTAPWGLSNPDIYVEMSLFSLSRAIRLMSMGRNVVMAWDSLARVLNYHSSSTYAQQQDEDGKEKDDGFISTGLKRSSLIEFLPRLNGFYGWIDESMSFTQLATILANSKSGAASAGCRDFGVPQVDLHPPCPEALGRRFRNTCKGSGYPMEKL